MVTKNPFDEIWAKSTLKLNQNYWNGWKVFTKLSQINHKKVRLASTSNLWINSHSSTMCNSFFPGWHMHGLPRGRVGRIMTSPAWEEKSLLYSSIKKFHMSLILFRNRWKHSLVRSFSTPYIMTKSITYSIVGIKFRFAALSDSSSPWVSTG